MKHRQRGKSIQLLGHGQRGFTLLELMISITILGLLLGLTIPSFRDAIQNNRIVSQNNEFITALTYARSEAIKRSDTVTVCSSANGASCSTTSNWSTGWITFVDLNADGALNGAEVVMQSGPPAMASITLNSPAAGGSLTNLRFSGSGMLSSTAGNFTLLKTGCTGLKARQIDVSVTGRVSTTKIACP